MVIGLAIVSDVDVAATVLHDRLGLSIPNFPNIFQMSERLSQASTASF